MIDTVRMRSVLRSIAQGMPLGLPPLETAGLAALAAVWLLGG